MNAGTAGPSAPAQMIDPAAIEGVLAPYAGDASALIRALQDVQDQFYYIPREALVLATERLGVPMTHALRVATFFKCFTLVPRGKHTVRVCTGTACHVRGASAVLLELQRSMGVEAGGTTKDLTFTLERVNCVGACALGPVVVVDDKYHAYMGPSKVSRLLKRYVASKEEH